MKCRAIALLAATALLAGCERHSKPAVADAHVGQAEQPALERCHNRGLQVYNDQGCMDAWKKRTDAFYDTKSGTRP